MRGSDAGTGGYEPLRYRPADDAPWYHVLHGNVPDHQIDVIYCPEAPHGLLTPTHFSHVARLMKYIEPRTTVTRAFAIGNLSRDDTQHEPGHGALALLFGLRIGGATDHAGRGHPPFAHAIIAVDRDVRHASLLEAASSFYRHVVGAGAADSRAAAFYRAYVRAVQESADGPSRVLSRYVESLDDLPCLPRSDLGWAWVANASAQPKRVAIVHRDDAPFEAIASAACRLAAVLYRSNIKWTSITTGREADIPGGITVRFVAERDVTAEDRKTLLLPIESLPDDDAEVAKSVFGAKPYGAEAKRPTPVKWRERYAAQLAPREGASAGVARVRMSEAATGGVLREETPALIERGVSPRTWVGFAALGACATLGVLGVMGRAAPDPGTMEDAPASAAQAAVSARSEPPAPVPGLEATTSTGAPPAAAEGAPVAQTATPRRAPTGWRPRRPPREKDEPESVFEGRPRFR